MKIKMHIYLKFSSILTQSIFLETPSLFSSKPALASFQTLPLMYQQILRRKHSLRTVNTCYHIILYMYIFINLDQSFMWSRQGTENQPYCTKTGFSKIIIHKCAYFQGSLLTPSILMAEYSATSANKLDIFRGVFCLPFW